MDQHDFVTLTREGYDRTAVAYAERFHHHLDDKPVDLAIVAAFAGLIRKRANKRVADVGCGTGVTTVPDEYLADVLSEFYRVLTDDGLVLLTFQVGDERRVRTSAFGYDVHLTFIRRQPRHVEEHLACAGFRACAQLVRQPDDDGFESTPQAYLIARKI